MKTRLRIKARLLILLLIVSASLSLSAQKIPLVYEIENTGAKFKTPALPVLEQLPVIVPLPDPFAWSDGKGRSTKFKNWSQRRAEIGAEIQHYEIGKKPDRPDTLSASYSKDTLTVKITENGKTLILKSKITLPEGKGPFPAVIGIGRGSGDRKSVV